VAEHNSTELALNESEARLSAVLESTSDAFYAVDQDWRLTVFNAAAERFFGLKRGQVLGHVLWDVFPQAPGTKIEQCFRQAMQKRLPEAMQTRSAARPDRIVELRIAPMAAGGVTVSLTDITERKKAEFALAERQRDLDAVLDNATVSVILLDEQQRCRYMNDAAERLTGFTLAEAKGRIMHDVVHHTRPDGSHYPLEECPIDRAFPTSNRTQGEEVFVHKDGSFYPVAFTASPIKDDEGRTTGSIVELRDVRREKQGERQQRLLMDELNHRVRNSLATVQSLAMQSFRKVAEECRPALDSFQDRLHALARAHNVLTKESWEGVELESWSRRSLSRSALPIRRGS